MIPVTLEVIPEFPLSVILILFLAATLFVLAMKKKISVLSVG
jgi:hypothetical protein